MLIFKANKYQSEKSPIIDSQMSTKTTTPKNVSQKDLKSLTDVLQHPVFSIEMFSIFFSWKHTALFASVHSTNMNTPPHKQRHCPGFRSKQGKHNCFGRKYFDAVGSNDDSSATWFSNQHVYYKGQRISD